MFSGSYRMNFGQLLMTAALVFTLSACSSKKKSADESMAPEGGATEAPQIDSAPMSFDVSGSDSGKISGLYTVNFEYDRSTLTADSKEKIQKNADWMKSNAKASLQIEGHCDSRGSIEYNLSLGERRAQAVKSYMASLGIPSNRMSIISYGKEKPLSNGDTEADHQKNRRANFVPISN